MFVNYHSFSMFVSNVIIAFIYLTFSYGHGAGRRGRRQAGCRPEEAARQGALKQTSTAKTTSKASTN